MTEHTRHHQVDTHADYLDRCGRQALAATLRAVLAEAERADGAGWATCPESGTEHRDWSAFAADTRPVARTCPHCGQSVRLSVERDGYWLVADHAWRPVPAEALEVLAGGVLEAQGVLTAEQAAELRRQWDATPRPSDPMAMCDRCGRTSWDRDTFGQVCGLLHPGGGACRGRMLVQRPGVAR